MSRPDLPSELDNVDAWRTLAGGMPLELGGVLIGAVGVSGGSAEEDQQAADAAVAALDRG